MKLQIKPSISRMFVVLGFAVMLSACYEIDKPVFPADNHLPLSDAAMFSEEWKLFQGQQRFYWDTWGTETLDQWPPAPFMLQLMEDESEVFGNQYQSFGFVYDPTDEFPVGFKRGSSDPDKVHETCALCHVAELTDGRVWAGAPNARLDLLRFKYEVNLRWQAAGNASLIDDLSLSKILEYGPGRTSAEPSSYSIAIPSSFPPYFNLSERTHLNYNGTGTSTKVETAYGLLGIGAGKKDGVPYPADFVVNQQLSKFIGVMSAPSAPEQDPILVEQGKVVFEKAQCGSCHHIDDIGLDGIIEHDDEVDLFEMPPGQDPDWPDGLIKTSPARMALLNQASLNPDGFLETILFTVKKLLFPRPSNGYRPSDLHGLWATAPYLHNGSVPSLMDLLSPAQQRPAVFDLHGFTFDTSKYGNSNQGHEFGVDLTEEEKQLLVMFLNSL